MLPEPRTMDRRTQGDPYADLMASMGQGGDDSDMLERLMAGLQAAYQQMLSAGQAERGEAREAESERRAEEIQRSRGGQIGGLTDAATLGLLGDPMKGQELGIKANISKRRELAGMPGVRNPRDPGLPFRRRQESDDEYRERVQLHQSAEDERKSVAVAAQRKRTRRAKLRKAASGKRGTAYSVTHEPGGKFKASTFVEGGKWQGKGGFPSAEEASRYGQETRAAAPPAALRDRLALLLSALAGR